MTIPGYVLLIIGLWLFVVVISIGEDKTGFMGGLLTMLSALVAMIASVSILVGKFLL